LLRTPVETSPFVIGRRPGLGLTLMSTKISEVHAEIARNGDRLRIRDLHSTNGTFVNRRRVSGPTLLEEGDVVHFADQEFRLIVEPEAASFVPGTARIDLLDLPRRFSGFRSELRSLLAGEAVRIRFEPIVDLEEGGIQAWEALAEGTQRDLPSAPIPLFRLASEEGLAAELSRLCRRLALEAAREWAPPGQALFLNSHPDEMVDLQALASSLEEVRELAGGRPLVLEIHESAVTDSAAIHRLRDLAEGFEVRLAYDDFGAGQARLLELADAPPHYLKFDRRLVSGLAAASPSRQRVIRALTAMARDLEISTIAEGVESSEDLRASRSVGFDAAQGYHFSRLGRAATHS
jgi:EAL domain-containing protein (putative c-di-GMP-specific phosphodiesterase class I)